MSYYKSDKEIREELNDALARHYSIIPVSLEEESSYAMRRLDRTRMNECLRDIYNIYLLKRQKERPEGYAYNNIDNLLKNM